VLVIANYYHSAGNPLVLSLWGSQDVWGFLKGRVLSLEGGDVPAVLASGFKDAVDWVFEGAVKDAKSVQRFNFILKIVDEYLVMEQKIGVEEVLYLDGLHILTLQFVELKIVVV